MENKVQHFYAQKDIKKQYKFWDTQLVPPFNKELPIKLGPLKTDFNENEIKKESYELPKKMEWVDIDITKEEELEKVYQFLLENYLEITEYKEQYNKEFLRWQFSPIKNNKYKNILISIQKEKKLIGFFAGLPMKLSVYDKEIMTYNISFLCIDKEYRKNKLAEIMFQEMFRRTYLENVYQNIFVTKRLIPKPFSESIYYYLVFDERQSSESKEIKHDVDSNNYIIKNETTVKFRPMEKKDIKSVTQLLYENQKKYKIHSIFSEDEVEHWFIPIRNVIYSFVREDNEDNDGKISDFTSFYKIDANILNKDENWSYIYFSIATSMSSIELIENAIILAKQNGMNCYICNTIMDYESVCKELNFHNNIEDDNSYGSLKYYFNNYTCPETNAKDMSLILI